MNAQDRGDTVNFGALRAAMLTFWEEFPNVHRSATLLTFYMDMFAKAHPDSVASAWASFVGCSSPVASELARGKVRFAGLRQHPLECTFSLLDGRTLDLRSLRGKVVLIDFWATWCKSCLTMNKTVFQDPEVRRRLEGYVKVKYQAETPDAAPHKEVLERFRAVGLPTLVVLREKDVRAGG